MLMKYISIDMVIHCQERLDRCLKMAKDHNDNSLQAELDKLKSWEKSGAERGFPREYHISADFEPNSFFSEHYADGERGICGGILFHGYDNQPDNSCAVCIDGPARGYRMHT